MARKPSSGGVTPTRANATEGQSDDHAALVEDVGRFRTDVVATLVEVGERLAADAEKARAAALERLDATVLAAFRKETEALRAEHQAELAERVQAIERAAERRERQAATERAAEADTRLSKAAERISEREARRVAEEIQQLATTANHWRARLIETLERTVENRITRLTEDNARRQAETNARLLAAQETRAEALAQRLEAEIAQRHRELVTRVENQVESALGDLQERLAAHAAALEQAVSKGAEEAEAARDKRAATALSAVEERLDVAVAEGERRLAELAGELQAGIAEAGREAGRANEEAEKYVRQIRAFARDEQPPGPDPALQLDANAANAHDLRGLGLSLTQATRMIGHRDALGGFTSVEQLDEVPGISKELRTTLKRCLAISEQEAAPPSPAAPPARPARAGRRQRLRPGRGGARAR